MKSAEIHFNSNESEFYGSCFILIEQILYHPLHDKLRFNLEQLHYQDIALLIRIADSFGRFDLGLHLRLQYCHNLEGTAKKLNFKRRDKMLYLMHQQSFGKELFRSCAEEDKIEVPFYLKRFHKRLTSKCDIKLNPTKTDMEFYDKIHNNTVALLAPGIIYLMMGSFKN